MSQQSDGKSRSAMFMSRINRMLVDSGDHNLIHQYETSRKLTDEKPDRGNDVIELWLTQIITKIVGMQGVDHAQKAEWINIICMTAKTALDQHETFNSLGEDPRTMLIKVSKHIVTSGTINQWGIQLLANSCRQILQEMRAKDFVAFSFPDKQTPVSVVIQRSDGQSPAERVKELEEAIRKHRDTEGEDRCWKTDDELYKVLPEGKNNADTRIEEPLVMLNKCIRYIKCHTDPNNNNYRSHVDEIKQLREVIQTLKMENDRLKKFHEADPF